MNKHTSTLISRTQPLDASILIELGNEATARLNKDNLYTHEKGKQIQIHGEPLIISKTDYDNFCRIAEDINLAQDQLARHLAKELGTDFGHHVDFKDQLCAPLKHNKALFLSRYDFIVDLKGQMKIIEFNSSCPAGVTFLHRWRSALSEIWPDRTLIESIQMPLDKPHYFPQKLMDELSKYNLAHPRPKVVLAVDNTNLTLELENFKKLFSDLSAQVKICNISKMKYSNGILFDHEGEAIDLIFNKMRPPRSVKTGWGNDELMSYASFLEAAKNDAACIFNPFTAMTIGEDKGMLAALQDEKYKNLIPDASRSAIQANLAKSAFVNPSNSDQLAWIIANQKNLVIKPRLEGRGDFVICGCSVTPEKWKHDVHACTENQWIVQEYIAPFKHRDILENSKSRTLAVYVIDGKACGMMSRVSSGMINNVAENGKIQPIFVTE